jgi:TolA-binding protein
MNPTVYCLMSPIFPLGRTLRRGVIVAAALLWLSPALAADAESTDAAADASAEVVSELDPAEMDAFRSARVRFQERMRELDADTQRHIALREVEERTRVADGYDGVIGSLEEVERDKRDVAIERFEGFLVRYGSSPYSSDVRFRLADLLWERARERWLEDHALYDVEEAELLAEGRFDELRPEPMVELGPSIELYKRIIEDNKDLPRDQQYEYLDGTYYMLGFAQKDENASERDEDAARAAFDELIRVRPDSDLVDTANLYIGNILFDGGQFDDAIARYQTVMSRGSTGRHYLDSMYYLAWSHYKMSALPEDYPRALALFDDLLEASGREFEDTGRRSNYEPDAIKYMAHSFSDISDMTGAGATEVADAYFASRGQRDNDRDIFIAMGDVLVQYGRYREAVGVYRRLQESPWEFEPDNPDHQFQVVRLLATVASSELDGNYEESAAARVELTARYNEGSPWWSANRNDPEALENALGYIEGSLSAVAREYWIAATRTGSAADYAAAAQKFGQYLDTFPIADDYYEHEWYLAAALYQADDFAGADAEYQKLVKSASQHGYGDGALYQGLQTRRHMLETKYGPPEQLPPSAPVERSYTTPDGVDIEVHALSEDHAAFLESVDAVLDHTFTPSDAEGALPYEGLIAAVDTNRPAFMYIASQILTAHHHYDEALPRLKALVDQYPMRNEASAAAGDVLDIYSALGDLDELRNHAKRYRMLQLGETDDRTEAFANLEEGAAFKQAQGLIAAGEFADGASAYLQFYRDYSKSDYAADALINAANNYQRAGKAEEAIELFEEFVGTYPSEPRAEGLYFRIAANYESIFELESAIRYYDELVTRFPDSEENASAALYNAAFLRTGLGDHLAAGAAYERYGIDYAARADAEDVYFKAAEQYELAGDAQAEAFYKRYLARYGGAGKPDFVLQAKHQLGEYALARGDSGSWQRYQDEVATDYRTFAAAGKNIGWKGVRYAAQGAFGAIQEEYDQIVSDVLSGDDQRDAVLVLEEKPAQVTAFEQNVASFISQYGDFEHSMAGLYLVASAYLYNADLIYSMDCPATFSAEQCDVYMELVYAKLYPMADSVQAKAVVRFEKVISTAATLGQYGEYVAKAKVALNQLDPFNYPDEKLEIPGQTDSTFYPDVEPRLPDVVDQPEPEPTGDPSVSPGPEEAAAGTPWEANP